MLQNAMIYSTFYYAVLLAVWFFHFLVYLLDEWSWVFPAHKHSAHVKDFADVLEEYDYIIVGAGTAGCVIAHRLAQNTSQNILLIEAGPLGSPIFDVPRIASLLQQSVVDWQYKTTPQSDAARSLNGRQLNLPRGKIVGGSGRLNYMLYVRGHPNDYQSWFPVGSKLQDFEHRQDFLRYYWKRSEDQQGRYRTDTERHGVAGPLIASDQLNATKLGPHMEQAAAELNISRRDLNAFYTGFDYPQVNVKSGARYSTGHFLIDTLQEKPNLSLLTHAEVWRVNFVGDLEASSVLAVSSKSGQQKRVVARHGIILSAGAINTPKILQLSGVGDPQHLKPLGIRPVINSPRVGMHLQDHVGVGLSLDSSLELGSASLLRPLAHADYIFRGRGPLSTVGCEGTIIAHLDCLTHKDYKACDEERRHKPPDFQLITVSIGMTTEYCPILYNLLNLSPTVYKEYYSMLHGTPAVFLIATILHPRSVGYVLINSTDPAQPPVINPNYLQHPHDIAALLKGVRFGQRMLATRSLQQLGATFDPRPFPGCKQHAFDSDAYWMCLIRHTTLTMHHPLGTAALGAVLDYNFRVKGTNKLFVADASAMPTLPSGNTNAVVVALAEIASDHIRHEFWLSTGVCRIEEVFTPKLSAFYAYS